MRKILSIVFFFPVIILGQSSSNLDTYKNMFPGTDTSLIPGQQLKVKDLEGSRKEKGYMGFFKDEKLKKIYSEHNYIYSKYQSLVSKVFDAKRVIKYLDSHGLERFKIELFNSETGVLYFDYDPFFEDKWPFEFFGNFSLPSSFFCDKIQLRIDKFTKDSTYTTPYCGSIRLIKTINSGKEDIFFYQSIIRSSVETNKTGAILLFDNGKKIDKPLASIDVNANNYGSGFEYTVMFALDKEDISLMINNTLTDTRMYLFDTEIKKDDIERLKEYLKCIIKTKQP